MKKSEAASQLAKRIQTTWPDLDQVSSHHCEHIISWLEEMGMSPPEYHRLATNEEIEYMYHKNSPIYKHPETGKYMTRTKTWEQES